jgi:transposase
MARLENFNKLTIRERQNRYFSEEFKRRKVEEIENNLTTIADIRKEYHVSATAVYKWIYKYSIMRKKSEKQVFETQSDTKKALEMRERIKDLERIIGQKQMMIDFQEKVIELAEKTYKLDIKKKFGEKLSIGSGITGENTTTE